MNDLQQNMSKAIDQYLLDQKTWKDAVDHINDIVKKEANKNSLNEKINEVTKKIEKYPFVENKINEQVALLKNILKSYGYYFVKLETSINKNFNNTRSMK